MVDIIDKSKCCGCSACSQRCPKQCIKMKEDKEGFLYPSVDYNVCIKCGICIKVCPFLNETNNNYPIKCLAIKHPSHKIQLESSSGGAFSLIAEYVIKEYNGIVFGAKFDNNWEVKHDYTDNLEGLEPLRMSKYVQSNIGDCFKLVKKFLLNNIYVMFVGTPCQIKGLKLFLNKEYDNLFTVDFVCHGVPSPMIWRNYINHIIISNKATNSNKQNIIKSIQFRNKKHGWKNYHFEIMFNHNKKDRKTIFFPLKQDNIINESLKKNVYLRGFIHDMYLRPSCYKCKCKDFSSGSDITLGDFWGVETLYPELYDKDGVSILTINTIKGEHLYHKLNTTSSEIEYEKIKLYNPSFYKSVDDYKYRTLFFKLYPHIRFKLLVISISIINKIDKIFKILLK